MITRRSLIAVSSAAIATAGIGNRVAIGQDSSDDVQVTNASFIRDLAATASPEASPAASPEATGEDFRGYIIGDPAAPNTLQIYADYRCPHCRIFHAEFEPGLIADFASTGRMNIEIIDFPVIGVETIDDLTDDTIESVQAAEAAAAAAEQGAWMEYRNWLYSGEERTSEGDFSDDNLIAAAEELGLDVDQFSTTLLDGVYEDPIIEGLLLGLDRGVEGTPTMILNGGEPFFAPGGGYEELKEIIEEGLQ